MPFAHFTHLSLHYETYGTGGPLLLLHAGWGLGVNGFAFQQQTLADEFQLIVPDRRGYGPSTRVDRFDADYHWQAAADMLKLLDALQIDRVLAWGHSDGAIIGAIMAITQPDRIGGLIFEGGHLYCRKPNSDYPMDKVYADPTLLPEAAQIKLAQYQGEQDWPRVIRLWAGGWLELYQRNGDLYRGRLGEIACPMLILHGAHDEHTFTGEIDELTRRVPHARLVIYPEGGHSIHDHRLLREACTQTAREFLRECMTAI
ncbi:MAG TPA: alpha/beta hydrolase [Anaerolineae bacterium]|nr:alpha/beta hydrolase [Anaerolineae bacterium]